MPINADLRNFELFRVRLEGPGFTDALLEGARDIVDLASQLAPEKTGELKQSGKAEVVGDGRVEISFGNGLPDDRAIAQEFGTHIMAAQPYLFPAIKDIDILLYVRRQLKLAF